jgi:cobalt/nickel transport system permease protein
MTLKLSSIPRTESALAKLDPRWKLPTLLVSALLVAFIQRLPFASVALLVAMALVLLGHVPVHWYLSRLGAIATFLLLVVCLLPLTGDRVEAAWNWGPVSISSAGAYLAGLVIVKALAIVTLILVLVATTPLVELLRAARALRFPGLLVHLAGLTYRYVFLIADEFARLRVALRVRGYQARMSRQNLQMAGNVAGTMLVRGQERAERISQAMACRGFNGSFRTIHSFNTCTGDVVFCLLLSGINVTILLCDRLYKG